MYCQENRDVGKEIIVGRLKGVGVGGGGGGGGHISHPPPSGWSPLEV